MRRPRAPTPPSLLEWALRVPEPKTGPLDFDRFPFQRELYELTADDHDVVIKKAAQVGISAHLVRWAIFWADMHAKTALYVFPKARQLSDFSDARIRPLILGSTYLRDRVPADAVQNKMLKQVGDGLIYFRGSESRDDLDAVDADVLALDEYDTLNQANIPDAERRVAASTLGLVRRVGVPSVPGYRISLLYEQSDQRVWQVRCGACTAWQPIEYWENVDEATPGIVCRHCRKPLDVTKGESVATYPDRGTKGYHVSRLLVPGTQLFRIVAASKEREPYKRQVFFNKDLGLDYAPEENRLSLAALQAAQRQYTDRPVVLGNESGHRRHRRREHACSPCPHQRTLRGWLEDRTVPRRGRGLRPAVLADGALRGQDGRDRPSARTPTGPALRGRVRRPCLPGQLQHAPARTVRR